MSDWPEVRLGDVTTQIRESVQVDQSVKYPLLGVRWYAQGAFLRETVTPKAKTLYRVQPGQFIYNRLFAWKGSFAVIPTELAGSYVSGEFPLFDCDRSRVLPQFLALVFGRPTMWEQIERVSTGTTTISRNRWNESYFSAFEVPLPPVAEQHRIVAVMEAVDAQVDALRDEVDAARRLLARLLETDLSRVGGEPEPIIGLCETVIGGAWGKPSGVLEADAFALGPRVYSYGTSTLTTDGSPTRSFTARQLGDRLVRAGDILLERSGGSPEQPVGRVVIAGSGLPPCVPTDFQRLLRPDRAKVEPRFLYWRLQSDWNSGVSSRYSRRTTGITNLSVRDYIAREIPVPPIPEQREFVAAVDTYENAILALAAELDALRTVRSNLLTALLTNDVSVAEAVDRIIEAA